MEHLAWKGWIRRNREGAFHKVEWPTIPEEDDGRRPKRIKRAENIASRLKQRMAEQYRSLL
jgi:hypothetical protein